MRVLALLGLCCSLALGCGHVHPVKVCSSVDMAVRQPVPVNAKVDASLNTLPDAGPLVESPVPPYGPHCAGDKVAVIDVDGLLLNLNPVGPYSSGENPLTVFQEKLTAAAADPCVKAVVLRINSPGGSVAATDLMWRSLVDFRAKTGKPVVACLLDIGAGGAYYLATGCDQIVAIPSSVVGGIGVMLNLYYLEVAMEQMNVFGVPIKAGERIDMGTSARKMTDEEKTMLTSMAAEYHSLFKRIVLQSRRITPDSDVFDGRVMSASAAKDKGLIDSVGYLTDAICVARQLARTPDGTVVMYRRASSPARSVYETVPNRPIQTTSLPWSVPGLDRTRLPLFLYLWQIEPTMMRLSGF